MHIVEQSHLMKLLDPHDVRNSDSKLLTENNQYTHCLCSIEGLLTVNIVIAKAKWKAGRLANETIDTI